MTSLVAETVKRLSTMWETWVWSLGWEDSLEKEMATHSSTLALKIPWTEELGQATIHGVAKVDSKVVSNHESKFGGGNVKIWGNDVPYFLRRMLFFTLHLSSCIDWNRGKIRKEVQLGLRILFGTMIMSNIFEDKDDLETIYHLIVSLENFSFFDLEYCFMIMYCKC